MGHEVLTARLATAALICVALTCAVTPRARAQAACDVQETVQPAHPAHALVIGDSTMLLSAHQLAAEGFSVDARGCRQFYQALPILASLRHSHRLPDLVVIALGANGPITAADVRQARRALGPRRRLVLVTPRALGGGGGAAAEQVRAAARGQVTVLDWVRHSARHSDWFQPDGLHLTYAGAAAFASFVGRALRLPPLPIDFGGVLAIRGGHATSHLAFHLRLPIARGFTLLRRATLDGSTTVGLHDSGGCAADYSVSERESHSRSLQTGAAVLARLTPPDADVLARASGTSPDVHWEAWTTTARTVGGAWVLALGDPFPHERAHQRAFLGVRVHTRLLAGTGTSACVRRTAFRLLRGLRSSQSSFSNQ